MYTDLQKNYRPDILELFSHRYKFTRHIGGKSAIIQVWKKSHGTLQAQDRRVGRAEMKEIQGLGIEQKWFQVRELTARESANMIDAYNHLYKHIDIYDAYKRPSETKVSVWRKWISWARDVNTFDDTYEVKNLSICATNCQMFTVCAIIREFEVDKIGNYLIGNRLPVATYIMVATKYYNYLYLLTSDENGRDVDLCW
jgi:hypothetical protein